jgi:hypothetical protein
VVTQPIEVVVKRYRCPFCPRSLSSKSRMADHIGKCWRNPAARGCKTCANFAPGEPAVGLSEYCAAGVDLRGGCASCGVAPEPGARHCTEHPFADMVMPGPIVDCDKWVSNAHP